MIIVLIAPKHQLKEGSGHMSNHRDQLSFDLDCWPLGRSPTPLIVYTGQNPRQHVVLIAIQPYAYNNYLSVTAGVILTFFGVIYFW
jgi:hypothetical protein